MNTKGTEYGSVWKAKNRWLVNWRNPIEQKMFYLGCFSKEDEAIAKLNKANFDFFEKHTWLLPKCIAVSRKVRKFVFSVQVKGKTRRIADFKSLDEAVQAKHEFITKLIS